MVWISTERGFGVGLFLVKTLGGVDGRVVELPLPRLRLAFRPREAKKAIGDLLDVGVGKGDRPDVLSDDERGGGPFVARDG